MRESRDSIDTELFFSTLHYWILKDSFTFTTFLLYTISRFVIAYESFMMVRSSVPLQGYLV